MSQFWSPQIRDLAPYVPGEQPTDPQTVKLNTNENPYPPAPAVARAIAVFDTDGLGRYPDPESHELRRALADYHAIDPAAVFVGNGSDEVLAHAFLAFFRHSEPLLFPDISYSFYPVYCKLYGIEYRQPPLDDAFEIDLADYATANGGIVFANPNAPTGIALPLAAVRELLADNPESVVLVDEAYVDFGADSALPLIDEFANLLVVRSFSKSRSLAGLRLGYAAGHPALIEGLERVKNSFNSYPIDRLTSALAIASVGAEDYFRATCRRIAEDRETLSAALSRLGFDVLPSKANFVFARPAGIAAGDLYRELKARDILVRYFSAPRIEEYLRITVGTEDECNALLDALGHILGPR